jgi:hypothetical protein
MELEENEQWAFYMVLPLNNFPDEPGAFDWVQWM